MKIIDFLKKYKMDSNADIFIESVSEPVFCKLEQHEVEQLEPEFIMNMTIKAIEVIDNVLTLYTK